LAGTHIELTEDGLASLNGCDLEWLPTIDLISLEEDTNDHQNDLDFMTQREQWDFVHKIQVCIADAMRQRGMKRQGKQWIPDPNFSRPGEPLGWWVLPRYPDGSPCVVGHFIPRDPKAVRVYEIDQE